MVWCDGRLMPYLVQCCHCPRWLAYHACILLARFNRFPRLSVSPPSVDEEMLPRILSGLANNSPFMAGVMEGAERRPPFFCWVDWFAVGDYLT